MRATAANRWRAGALIMGGSASASSCYGSTAGGQGPDMGSLWSTRPRTSSAAPSGPAGLNVLRRTLSLAVRPTRGLSRHPSPQTKRHPTLQQPKPQAGLFACGKQLEADRIFTSRRIVPCSSLPRAAWRPSSCDLLLPAPRSSLRRQRHAGPARLRPGRRTAHRPPPPPSRQGPDLPEIKAPEVTAYAIGARSRS